MTKSNLLTRPDIERAMRAPSSDPPEVWRWKGSVMRRAAVLCPIIERANGLSVILTKRTDHLKAHPGQISFPGGKIDRGDGSPMNAALREAEEEIGLIPSRVDIAGSLDPYPTGTGFLVTPFVGFVDHRFQPVPEPGEVAEVFDVPLDFLMNSENYVQESLSHNGKERLFYVIKFGEYRIWGATAGMLHILSTKVRAVRSGGALL